MVEETKLESGSNDTSENNSSTTQQSFITPGRAFLFSSIPLTLGTYLGYRRAMHESSLSMQSVAVDTIASASSSTTTNNKKAGIPKPTTVMVSTIPPPVIAARALILGSLVSLSGTSLLVAGIFYASGCHSLEDLMSTWKRWAPRKLREFEGAIGLQSRGDERRSSKVEYERAVKGMSEEEELEYVGNKYGTGEVDWDEPMPDTDQKK
mmetsp:Transcript_23364/g.35394  ORF Transcript_23364/g.35394 Transcript_23364/m.35394 type:complete len:208 (+) Transcript_23364:184-807(+)